MNLHFTLNAYWLLLLFGALLVWWALPRKSEMGGYIPSIAPLLRMAGAAVLFVLGLCALLAVNLWLK